MFSTFRINLHNVAFMITRIIIAAIAASIVAPVTFGQMKYSRPRSQSPTPSPTPTPTPQSQQQQRLVPVRAQSPMPQQRTVLPQPGRPMLIPPKEAAGTTTIQPRSTPALAVIPPRLTSTPAPTPAKPTATPVPLPDVNAYLDRQIANSKDKKFHMTVNGRDLALTPFHVWPQKNSGPNTTSTSISMRSDEGKVYDIEFVTAGAQVTGIRIQRINGEAMR